MTRDRGSFTAVAGRGSRERGGREVELGNRKLFEGREVVGAGAAQRAEELRRKGQTVVFVAADGDLLGLLGVADPIKENARAAIDALRREGLRIVMLTGDGRVTAEAVASRLGIEHPRRVLPDEKAGAIARSRRNEEQSRWPATGSTLSRLARADSDRDGTGTDIASRAPRDLLQATSRIGGPAALPALRWRTCPEPSSRSVTTRPRPHRGCALPFFGSCSRDERRGGRCSLSVSVVERRFCDARRSEEYGVKSPSPGPLPKGRG